MDAKENRKEELLTSLTSAMESLSFRKEQIKTTKMVVESKNEECIEKLHKEEEIIVQMVKDMFASLMSETVRQKSESSSSAGSEMTSLEEKMGLLNNIKLSINKQNMSQTDIINYQETVNSVAQDMNLKGSGSFRFFEYESNNNRETLVKELCGELTRRDFSLETQIPGDIFSEPVLKSDGRCDDTEKETSTVNQEENLGSKFQLKWSVERCYETSYGFFVTTAGTDSAIVCGKDVNIGWTMTHYSLLTGEVRGTAKLGGVIKGMTTVLFKNRTCVALSDRSTRQIEFRPAGNLGQILSTWSIGPHEPGILCGLASSSPALTQSPSGLTPSSSALMSSMTHILYQNFQTNPCTVQRVDCTTTPPTLQEQVSITYDGQRVVLRMCYSRDLLVISRGFDGVFAYMLRGGECKWRVSGKPAGMQHEIDARGVTADERGHLFVCDVNNRCVHVLSIPDGTYQGVVVRKGQDDVGKPREIACHEESASLVVAHYKDTGCFILSVFSCRD